MKFAEDFQMAGLRLHLIKGWRMLYDTFFMIRLATETFSHQRAKYCPYVEPQTIEVIDSC